MVLVGKKTNKHLEKMDTNDKGNLKELLSELVVILQVGKIPNILKFLNLVIS